MIDRRDHIATGTRSRSRCCQNNLIGIGGGHGNNLVLSIKHRKVRARSTGKRHIRPDRYKVSRVGYRDQLGAGGDSKWVGIDSDGVADRGNVVERAPILNV